MLRIYKGCPLCGKLVTPKYDINEDYYFETCKGETCNYFRIIRSETVETIGKLL